MSAALLVLVPLLVIPVVGLLAFAGCSPFGAEDPPKEPDTPKKPDEPVKPPKVDQPTKKSYAETIAAQGQGLTAYWRLSGGGSTATDEGASHLDGTFAGDLAPTQGTAGGALTPRGSDSCSTFTGDGYVRVPYNALLNPSPGLRFSFEVWVRFPTERTTDAEEVIASLRSFLPGFTSTGWELYVRYAADGTPTFGGRLFHGSGVDDTHAEVDVPTVAAADAWHHVAMSYDGSGVGTLTTSVRVVGDPNTYSTPVTRPTYVASGDANSPFLIGAGNAPLPAAFFNGDLDEAAFYLTALNTSQLAEHFDAATKAS